MDSKEIDVVRAFITAINEGDIIRLSGLLTEDHTFVDSGGRVVSVRENLTEGWKQYFRMFPDYRIQIQNLLQDKEIVAVFGFATGSYSGKRGPVPENRIQMPAAWKVVVEDGKIKLWQVYADWSEGSKIIDEDRAKN